MADRILERLSANAPVIAVHGNDTTRQARRALLYGFRTNFERFCTTIFDPEMAAVIPALRANLPPNEGESLRQLVWGLARRCWTGEFDELTMSILVGEAEDAGLLADKAKKLIADST